MSTMTIRLPDDKHERLKALAENRQISVNKLIDELATIAIAIAIAIANRDAHMRFATRAARGDAASALQLLRPLGDL